MNRGRPQPKQGPPPLAAERAASIIRRSLAWIMDVLVVTAIIFLGVSAVDELVGPAVTFRLEAADLPGVVTADKGVVVAEAVVATALSAGYFVIPWTLFGGSPGQLALRMRVRDEAGGEGLSVGRSLIRWLLLFPPFATLSALTAGAPLLGWLVWGSALAWYLVLLLTAVRSETNRGFHDRVAGSVVQRPAPAAHGAVGVR
jgi:RDD family